MGWAGGSRLFDEVIQAAKLRVEDYEARVAFYEEVIEAFEDEDWDTQDECLGEDPAFDEALYNLHPEWKDEEDDDEV